MPEERKFSPGPFIKSFLDRPENYPKTKHYSENCYAKVMVILFFKFSRKRFNSTQGRKKKKTHRKQHEKEYILNTVM